MPRHRPDPTQADLFADRGRLIRLLRNFTLLKTPAQKLMLCMLDSHLGKYTRITLDIRTLAEQTIVSVSSAYRLKDELSEMGLLVAKEVGSRRFEFSIGWARMAAIEEETTMHEDDEPTDLEPVEVGESRLTHKTADLMDKTSDLTGKTSHLAHETARLTHKTHIRNSDSSPILTPISSSTSTDAVDATDAAKEAVMLRLMDCGVNRIGQTVDAALNNGLTIEQIHAVIDHFTTEGNSGRWSPNILVERLTSPGMHLATPDRGWWGDNPEWKARQQREAHRAAQVQARAADKPVVEVPAAADCELEAAHGAILDAMSQGERRALLQFAAERQLVTPFFHRSITNAGHEAHKSKLYRKTFLEALKAKSTP